MLHDAERFKAEDETVRKTVELRNQLESYLYGCKTVRRLFLYIIYKDNIKSQTIITKLYNKSPPSANLCRDISRVDLSFEQIFL